MQNAVLTAFFVIHNELNCDIGAAGPRRVHRVSAIASHISYITHLLSLFLSEPRQWKAGYTLASRLGESAYLRGGQSEPDK